MFHNFSLKWKILVVALAGPVIVAAITAWQRVDDIRTGAEEAIIQKSRAVVLMAEAARNEVGRKLEMGLMRPLADLPRSMVMDAVPVITAVRLAAQNAEQAGYEFRAPKVRPRNLANTPTPLELSAMEEMERNNLAEKVIRTPDKIYYFRPIRLTADCLYCHGDPAGQPDVVGGIKEGWKAGETHGAFMVASSLENARQHVMQARIAVVGWTSLVLVLLFLVVWVTLNRSIIGPLLRIREFASQVAGGALDARAGDGYNAELGELKGAMETMVGNLKQKMQEADQRRADADAHAERAEQALAEAREQETRINGLLRRMTSVAGEASTIAQHVSLAAEALSAQVEQVSAGAERQSARAGETATAMEEMNATVLEVARSSGNSAQSAEEARAKAQQGQQVVGGAVDAIGRVYERTQALRSEMTALGGQAEDIGRIMDVISDIADQTNLLALNAAIEAARAGDAGRGFAVVADEVRKLAEKTMNATKEVGQAIQSIQTGARNNIQGMEAAAAAVTEATRLARESGQALEHIVVLSEENSDQVRSIATAAEQQSATSEEINRAVEDISRIASETAEGMTQAAGAVMKLAELAKELERQIDQLSDGDART